VGPPGAVGERGLPPAHQVGVFPELKEQLTTWVPGERSPDRMDALVWALSAIFYPTEEHEFVVVYDSPVSISPY
jgi:phage terminase large subunit-like protein